MWILTDCSEELAGRHQPGEPLPEGRAAWSVLADAEPDCLHTPDWSPHLAGLVVVKEAAGSQFSALQSHLSGGGTLPDGLLTLALQGTGFKGQRDRNWIALPGNLHACFYFTLDIPLEALGAGLTMLPTVAVIDALAELLPGAAEPPGIKWINDVLWQGRKIAGSLASTRLKEARVEDVLFGIGINIAASPDGLPGQPAACLHELPGGENLSWPRVAEALALALDHRLRDLLDRGPEPLFQDYRNASCILDREVEIWPVEEGAIEPLCAGVVTDITPDLAVLLAHHPHPITEGRLQLRGLEPSG